MKQANPLKNASYLAKQKKYDEALQICDEYIACNRTCREGYKKRSYVNALMKNWKDAIKDVSIFIDSGSNHPGDYFSRGRWQLHIGNLKNAVSDFTKALEIENKNNLNYYSETVYFHRAKVFLMLKEFSKAIEDCQKVRDDFTIYLLGKIITRNDILNEAFGSVLPYEKGLNPD